MSVTRLARQRRHTLYFLRFGRAQSPVFLTAQIDMTTVMRHQSRARDRGVRCSVLSYVLRAVTTVLEKHPECNVAVGTGLVPRCATFSEIKPKIALDKTVDGIRVVLSAVLPDLRGATLADIQAHLVRLKDTPPEGLPELHGALTLHRLPRWVGWAAFRLMTGRVSCRDQIMGSVAVSSLGQAPIEEFHTSGGTPLTVNLGQVKDTPVVRDNEIVIAPVLKVNLCFDHRVVDGATAADVLAELKDELEREPHDEPYR